MIVINEDVNYNTKTLAVKLGEMQQAKGEVYDPEAHMAVTVMFPTVQGEAPFAGYPAVFLRLAGCNRGQKLSAGCAFCFPTHHTTMTYDSEIISFETDERKLTPRTKMLRDIRIDDTLPSYSQSPTTTAEQIKETKVTNVVRRMVTQSELVIVSYQSTLNEAMATLICTKEHPIFVHGAGGEVGIFKRADELTTGDTMHGAALQRPFDTKINVLRVLGVKPVDDTTFRNMVQEQIDAGVLDRHSATFNTESISVTSLTTAPHSAFMFRDVFVHNCDTYFKVGEKTRIMEINDVVKEVVALADPMESPLLVITGGEPLLQSMALQAFLMAISETEAFYMVQFETNGDLFATNAAQALFDVVDEINDEFEDDEPFINFVISPKREIREPKTGAFMQFAEEEGYYVRLVVSGDPNSVYYTIPEFLLDGWPRGEFYVSPLTEYQSVPKDDEIADIRTDIDIDATRRNVARAIDLATQFGLKVSFQAHSYIGIK